MGCNAWNHPPNCTCGWGGDGHLGRRDQYGNDSYGAYCFEQLTTFSATSSTTARYISPTYCPVCGQEVFFYQNAYGSKVFFDELGPPWPKHPCTDNETYRVRASHKKDSKNITFPVLRSRERIDDIFYFIEKTHLSRQDDFLKRYGFKQWGLWTVEDKQRRNNETLLILLSLSFKNPKLMYLAIKRLPRTITKGTLLFYKRGKISFFDPDKLKSIELSVTRIPSASKFIQRLISFDID